MSRENTDFDSITQTLREVVDGAGKKGGVEGKGVIDKVGEGTQRPSGRNWPPPTVNN